MRYFLMTLAAALALTMFTAADSQAKPGRSSGGQSGREVQKIRVGLIEGPAWTETRHQES